MEKLKGIIINNNIKDEIGDIDPETLKKMWDKCLPKIDKTLGLGKIIIINKSNG